MPGTKLCLFTLCTLLFSLCALPGCSSKPATLVLHPTAKHVAYAQSFTQCYAGRADDGSPMFLLVADDTTAADRATDRKGGKPGDPLRPAADSPLRQVVYIKVLWRPLSGIRESLATNAAIDWYVMSNTVEGRDDLLLYQGAGYVTVNPGDDASKVTIQSAELRPTQSHGNLQDPIGPAGLTGTFTAVRDDARLRELLAATRDRTAALASTR
jgi:hypothetical protein